MITLIRLQVRNFKSLHEIDLTFPRQASVLVEGLNEAGKSSLFEAIYFALYGEPIVVEETGQAGRGSYESAINYQAKEATVILNLEVDGTTLEVERTIHRVQSTKLV